ncbi:MAG: hypothetical protein IPK03_04295 [Bacteroidetes bacterium]|nr:hypothetical protein [Bacteroidota bacterium]
MLQAANNRKLSALIIAVFDISPSINNFFSDSENGSSFDASLDGLVISQFALPERLTIALIFG